MEKNKKWITLCPDNELDLELTFRSFQTASWKSSKVNKYLWHGVIGGYLFSIKNDNDKNRIIYKCHNSNNYKVFHKIMKKYFHLDKTLHDIKEGFNSSHGDKELKQEFEQVWKSLSKIRLLRQTPRDTLLYLLTLDNLDSTVNTVLDHLLAEYGTCIGEIEGTKYYRTPSFSVLYRIPTLFLNNLGMSRRAPLLKKVTQSLFTMSNEISSLIFGRNSTHSSNDLSKCQIDLNTNSDSILDSLTDSSVALSPKPRLRELNSPKSTNEILSRSTRIILRKNKDQLKDILKKSQLRKFQKYYNDDDMEFMDLWLLYLRSCSYFEVLSFFKYVRGTSDFSRECIALFALSQYEALPIDFMKEYKHKDSYVRALVDRNKDLHSKKIIIYRNVYKTTFPKMCGWAHFIFNLRNKFPKLINVEMDSDDSISGFCSEMEVSSSSIEFISEESNKKHFEEFQSSLDNIYNIDGSTIDQNNKEVDNNSSYDNIDVDTISKQQKNVKKKKPNNTTKKKTLTKKKISSVNSKKKKVKKHSTKQLQPRKKKEQLNNESIPSNIILSPETLNNKNESNDNMYDTSSDYKENSNSDDILLSKYNDTLDVTPPQMDIIPNGIFTNDLFTNDLPPISNIEEEILNEIDTQSIVNIKKEPLEDSSINNECDNLYLPSLGISYTSNIDMSHVPVTDSDFTISDKENSQQELPFTNEDNNSTNNTSTSSNCNIQKAFTQIKLDNMDNNIIKNNSIVRFNDIIGYNSISKTYNGAYLDNISIGTTVNPCLSTITSNYKTNKQIYNSSINLSNIPRNDKPKTNLQKRKRKQNSNLPKTKKSCTISNNVLTQ